MTILAQFIPDRYAAVAASCNHGTPGGLSCLPGSHQNSDRISVAALTAALQARGGFMGYTPTLLPVGP